jgi:MFS family permease
MKKQFACLAAALFSFYDLFMMALFNRLNASLQLEFHLNPHSVGILSSFFLWGNAIGLIPIGYLLDKGHIRKVVCFLLTTSILSSLVFVFSHSSSLAMAARFVQGLASAGSLLTCMRLGINWYKEKANMAIGWMISIALSGGIVANFIDTWKAPFWIGLAIFIFIIIYLRDAPDNLSEKKPFYFITKPQNFLIGGYLGFINFPVFVLGALWGDTYLINHFHLTLWQSSIISSLIFVGIIIGSPFWGFISSHYINYKKILYLGCIGLIGLCFLLKFLPLTLLSISLIFFSLGFLSCTQNLAYFLISETNAPEMLSSATAIASVIFNGIGALSQTLLYFQQQLALLPIFALILLIICQKRWRVSQTN